MHELPHVKQLFESLPSSFNNIINSILSILEKLNLYIIRIC
jgi:hypothetical protein